MDAIAPKNELFAFDNSYARLPARMFARLNPEAASAPELLELNRSLAEELGLDANQLASTDGVSILSGSEVALGSEPLAMAYAGHQFGNWVPQLGDGRALLLGEVIDTSGQRRDIQLKGSGQTPFSRMGDGKSPLGPALREYIISEAMAALGIPTTRSLAVVATGEDVVRQRMETGAVLTRVAASHVRVGTFQYFYARDDKEALQALANYVIARHYPSAADSEIPALELLNAVMHRQANLIASWMSVGFIHGVMNTDNMTISGETIDYGPCAFMDTHKDGQVFSSIDQMGRYAYANQPQIAHWNLAQLAQALLPLVPGTSEEAIKLLQDTINRFPAIYGAAWHAVMRTKLGLNSKADGDANLIAELFATMEANKADFTLTFRRLMDSIEPGSDAGRNAPGVRDLFADPTAFDAWAEQWRRRLAEDEMENDERRIMMRAVNPAFIPRNHRVEEALKAAEDGDLEPMRILNKVLARPFDDQPEYADYANPPGPGQGVFQTFCGT